MTTEVKVLTIPEIMQAIAAAGASGDIAEVVRLGNLLKKHQAEIAKAEAEALQKEAEALAGDRAKLAGHILETVLKKYPDISEKLAEVKATGFVFTLTADGSKGLVLSVPTIKTRIASTGNGGSTGKLKEQTGLSRHELVEKYATEAEKADIAAKTEAATNRPDSVRYQAETPVVKRILAEHPELIRK